MPPDKANEVLALPAPMDGDRPDSVRWKDTSTCYFKVSAYELQSLQEIKFLAMTFL
jgi:hypothetical protein